MNLIRKVVVLCIALSGPFTQAAALNTDLLDLTQLSNRIPQDIANESAKAFGILLAHRPYQGAISISENEATEFKLEITMIKIGDGLLNALSANGVSGTSLQDVPSIPIPKAHLRKSLGPMLDLGLSGIFFSGQYAVGGDLKWTVYAPEEGLNAALRFGYTYITAPDLNVKSISVISPELVFSRRLSFAEPYIGLGGRSINGTVEISFPDPIGKLSKSGSGTTAYAFTGVNFVLGPKGLRLALEGTLDSSGYSSVGTMIGVAF